MSFLPPVAVIYELYSVRYTLQSYNTNIYYVPYSFLKCISPDMSKNVPPVRVFKIITLALGEVGGTVEGHFLPCTQEVHHY